MTKFTPPSETAAPPRGDPRRSRLVYQTYITRSNLTQAPPQQQIDVIGVRSDLLTIGQAERQYLIAHETYGTLEALRQDGLTTVGTERRGCNFSAVVDGSRAFTITATPSDASKVGWPTLAINETMQITER